MSQSAHEQILDEAAQWLALLDSGHASAQEERAFLEWQARDPRHASSIQAFRGQMLGLQGAGLGRLAPEQLLKTIKAPSSRRAFIRNATGLLGISAAAILTARALPDDIFAFHDLVSGTGQRRQLQLPDGSQLLLNARSRITPDFGDGNRHLILREGELQVAVAQGRQQPLRIETPAGVISSLDSLLQVRRDAQQTRVLVLSSNALLTTLDGQRLTLKAGQGAWFNGQGQLEVRTSPPDALLWVKGLMKVYDQPLGSLIDELRTYRSGIIRVSPQAAQLRVSGIYSLDDTRKTLLALRDSLGLDVQFYTDYWVSISLPERAAKT